MATCTRIPRRTALGTGEEAAESVDPNVADSAQAAAAATAATDTHAHPDVAAEATTVDDKGLSLLENGHMAHVYRPGRVTRRIHPCHPLSPAGPDPYDRRTISHPGRHACCGKRAAGAFGPGHGDSHVASRHRDAGHPAARPVDPWIPGTLTDAEVLRPANLLYDGATDDSRLAGFMYYSTSPVEPEGFAAPTITGTPMVRCA